MYINILGCSRKPDQKDLLVWGFSCVTQEACLLCDRTVEAAGGSDGSEPNSTATQRKKMVLCRRGRHKTRVQHIQDLHDGNLWFCVANKALN